MFFVATLTLDICEAATNPREVSDLAACKPVVRGGAGKILFVRVPPTTVFTGACSSSASCCYVACRTSGPGALPAAFIGHPDVPALVTDPCSKHSVWHEIRELAKANSIPGHATYSWEFRSQHLHGREQLIWTTALQTSDNHRIVAVAARSRN